MRYFTRRHVVAVIAVSAVALATPTASLAVTRQHAHAYLRAYHAVAEKFGHRAPGRNIIRDGALHGKLTDRMVVRSVGVLRRMLHPVPSPRHTASASPVVTNTTDSSPLPSCTWRPESGGDPTAVNPSSGAGGYYQIIPSTWAAEGGTGLPQDASMAEQTKIAQRIAATQGLSAWVNC